MAGIAYVYKRLWNPELLVDPDDVLKHNCRRAFHGSYKPMYEIKWRGATQAGEELGTAGTSLKDGTTTPFQLTVVSTSASDDRGTGAGMVHSVAVIGISVEKITSYAAELEVPKLTVEVIHMDGTTDVLSTRYYLWVDHVYACAWGSGATHDAEGVITVESPANTNLLVLAATFNESEGGTWHFRKDCCIQLHALTIKPTAALAAGDGCVLTATHKLYSHAYDDANIIDLVDTYPYIHYGMQGYASHGSEHYERHTATNSATCTWSEALVANTQTIDIKIFQQCRLKQYTW